ncbi:MAG: PIN domain-containing protein [Nitrospirota bacterium]
MFKAFIDTSVILRLLVKDDDIKQKSGEKLIKGAKDKGITLYLLSIAVMETVFVLEKVYKLDRKVIREMVLAILNTPEIKVEMEDVFRSAIEVYAGKNIRFADAVMGYSGLEKGLSTVYTYDEKDFKKIEGLEVRKP